MRLKKFNFGRLTNKEVYTCSDCTNDSLLNEWSLTSTAKDESELAEIERDLSVSAETIQQIATWADKKLEQKKIGWMNVFTDLETVKEYRDKFFSHLDDTKIFSLYFSRSEADDLIEEFEPLPNCGTLGIWDNLTKGVAETDDNNEVLIGYDLIGIEESGRFHSFNCHDIADQLIEKFRVTINKHGLIDEQSDWTSLTEFMNDEANGFEPVPWFVCKVKMRLE